MLHSVKFRHLVTKTETKLTNICRCALASKRFLNSTSATYKEAVKYDKGSKLHGYTILESVDVPEYHATATLLRHNQTGAEHLHVYRDDQNNVFSVGFRTTPLDSSGVPHILEHTVLCGSKKYPCRDPFFKMLNRSLSTFMNAFTASDWTMYPFSTQNHKDYFNLMSVYLDATFHPNLKELDFRQEGWRLEHSDLEDKSSDIMFKGVVFNEMKGALSNAESLYHTYHQSLLLPSHTYGFVSGGDPLHIPNLTWNTLKDFHASHYHPSNSKFYTYGNFPLEETLVKVENVLKDFQSINPGTEIPVEPKWSKPRYSTITCPPDPLAADPNKQTIISVSYMLNYIDDPFEYFVLGMLSALLVSGPNSPFYQALIEPNIGSDYSPVVGVDTHTKNPTFAVGLQGIDNSDCDKVVGIIDETFRNVVNDGFDASRIESILHAVELSKKHQSSNFGLGLIMALFPSWNKDQNPLSLLDTNTQVKRFRETLEMNPTFLQDKVKEYFMDNTHRLTLVMNPENDYNTKKEEAEQTLLEEKINTLTDKDRDDIYLKGLKLDEIQNKVEDVSFLPKVLVSEIDKSVKTTEIKNRMTGNIHIQTCEQPTNGITYFRSIATTSSIPYILKPFLPLFCSVLTRLGAGGRDYKQLAQDIEHTTGGLNCSPHLAPHHSDEDSFEQGLIISSHCLDRNIPMMFSLWQDVLTEPQFDNPDRLRTLINSYASDLAMSVAQSGHMYAMAAAAKNLTPSAQIAELFGGLSQVEFMREVAEKESVDDVIESLMKIATYMLNANEMRCSLNATSESMLDSDVGLDGMLSSLNVVGFDDLDVIEDLDFNAKSQNTFIEMDFPVNYVSRCVRAVPYTHIDHASLKILAKIISSKFLHREIREKGGAYGSGAKIDGGVFSFFSYRDPNTTATLNAFDESVIWAGDGKFTDEDIEEAKLSVFAAVDSPISPGNRGMALFKYGLTDELRQDNRDKLFSASRSSIIDVAQRYLLPGKQVDSKAVIGPKDETLIQSDTWKSPMKIELPS